MKKLLYILFFSGFSLVAQEKKQILVTEYIPELSLAITADNDSLKIMQIRHKKGGQIKSRQYIHYTETEKNQTFVKIKELRAKPVNNFTRFANENWILEYFEDSGGYRVIIAQKVNLKTRLK